MQNQPALSKGQKNRLLLILGGMAAIGPFAVDMYLPGFSAIARDLKTDIAHVGLTLTSYILGIAIGQLMVGPVLDRFGRRTPIIVGLLTYLAAAVGCMFVPSINYLIGLRFVLALGCCVGMVGSSAIVRDLFSGSDIARAMSLLMVIFGVAPIVAPTIGGFVVASAGWRMIFVVLAAIGASVVAAIAVVLPETKERDARISLRPDKVLLGYLDVLRDRQFVAYAMVGSAASAGLFSYITASPFVFINLFGFNPRAFGWIFGANALATSLAGQMNRVLLRRLQPSKILFIMSGVQAAVGLALLGGTWMAVLPKGVFIGLVASYLFCFGFLLPNSMALLLQPFSKNAGSASALSGSLTMLAGTVASALVSYFHSGTAVPMAYALAFCAAIGFVASARAMRRLPIPSDTLP